MENTIYKDIKGYEGLYKISNTGHVLRLSRSVINNRNGGKMKLEDIILKEKTKKNGYKEVCLLGKMFYVHRLVAGEFIEHIKNGLQVNHIDGNKSNNNVNNLEIVTPSKNSIHAYKNGLKFPTVSYGSNNGNSKINEETVLKIRELYNLKKSIKKINLIFSNLKESHIQSIVYRKSWKHI